MNNTTKAKYDMATRMLKGRLDVEDVAEMTGLTLEQVEKLKEEVVPRNPDAEVLSKLDTVDFDMGQILYDDAIDEDEGLNESSFPGKN